MRGLRDLILLMFSMASVLLMVTENAGAVDSTGTRGASNSVFNGDLGRWLEQQAIPELVTLVGNHPRFRGEQIRVVTMADGLPTLVGNGLSHALRDRLTQQLTRVKGVQIAWRNKASRCDLPDNAPYLLGVEVVSEPRTSSLVTIAMVDVEEGIWVSGGYLQWRGTLTHAERRAFAQSATAAPAGSIDSPLPASEQQQISVLLRQQIECSLQGGLEGGVQVTTANRSDELLDVLVQDLRESLVHSATVSVVNSVVAGDKDSTTRAPEWRLELSAANGVGESIVATLHSPSAGSQLLATVYVRRAGSANAALASPAKSDVERINKSVLPLIEQPHEVPVKPGDACFRRSAECLEVQFELLAPSYLFVMRTQASGVMNLGGCGAPKITSGTKRFRMQIRDAGAGFYALATTDSRLARRLHRSLAAGAKNCGERVHSDWLDRLEVELAETNEPVDWRTFRIPARLVDEPVQNDAFATAASSGSSAMDYSRENER